MSFIESTEYGQTARERFDELDLRASGRRRLASLRS
jgi:hypothetical protein